MQFASVFFIGGFAFFFSFFVSRCLRLHVAFPPSGYLNLNCKTFCRSVQNSAACICICYKLCADFSSGIMLSFCHGVVQNPKRELLDQWRQGIFLFPGLDFSGSFGFPTPFILPYVRLFHHLHFSEFVLKEQPSPLLVMFFAQMQPWAGLFFFEDPAENIK